MPASVLRSRWDAGEAAFGVAVRLPCTWTVEAVANTDLDFIWFDMQHGQIPQSMLISMLQATRGSELATLVRVPSNDVAEIGRALDSGADGIIVPMVESAQDAERAVAACRFGPRGLRSHGALRLQFLGGVHRDVVLFMMVETARGVENALQIASVPGVDGLFLGPSDLALSMGLPLPATGNVELARALERCRQACVEVGSVACITGDPSTMRERGYQAISIGADHMFFDAGLQAALASRRGED